MAEEIKAPAAPAGEQTAATPAGQEAASTTATADGKFYTNSELNDIIQRRLERDRSDKGEQIAAQKTAELQTTVQTISEKLAAAELKSQLLEWGGKGVDTELLEATGLKGDALNTYAEKLAAKLGAGGGSTTTTTVTDPLAAPASAASSAAIADRVNRIVATSNKPTNWKDDVVASMDAQLEALGGAR